MLRMEGGSILTETLDHRRASTGTGHSFQKTPRYVRMRGYWNREMSGMLCGQAGQFDIKNGWSVDERNWAILTAAENTVETAEQAKSYLVSSLLSVVRLCLLDEQWSEAQ